MTRVIGFMGSIEEIKSNTSGEIAREPPIDDKLVSKRHWPVGNRAHAKLIDCDEEVIGGFLEEHVHTLF